MQDARVKGAERGFSLIEISIVLFLMVIVAAIFYELIIASSRVSMFTESHNDIATIGQRVVNKLQIEMIQSKLLYQEDSTGSAYRTLFTSALPAGTTVWTNSRLPIIDSNTTAIGPDPGPNGMATRTGNSLIVVRELQPVSISYDHDGTAATANINFMADRYEFQYYFLRQNTLRDFGGFGYYLEIMQAKTQTFADYFQLNSVTVNKNQLVTGLRALSPSIQMAWDPGKDVSAPAFYNLNSAGTITSNVAPQFALTVVSMMPEFLGGRIAGKMQYSVGLNTSTPLAIQDPIPLYATASSNFPGGLEFQAVGATSSRKVVARLVLVSGYANKFKSGESSVMTSVRGF